MSQLKRNIVANLLSQVWAALLPIACVPIYTKCMGIEAYGLVGFLVMLRGLSMAFDLGIGPTMVREMASFATHPGHAQDARNFVRTVEIGFSTAALLIAGLIVCLSPWLAHNWVHSEHLPVATVQAAMAMMGVITGLQFLLGLYAGGMRGLDQQMTLSGIIAGFATLRGAGSVAILWFVSPNVLPFFTWQMVVSAAEVATTGFSLHCHLPAASQPACVQIRLLQPVWRFSVGISGTMVLATVLMQLDKIILSRVLSLEMFGYYTLAFTVANGISSVSQPILSAYFPRFAALVKLGDHEALAEMYHHGCQVMSALLLPIAVVLALFSWEVLLLWTRNPDTAHHTAEIVSLLVIGTTLNGLMSLPYYLQLAYGWSSLAFYLNLGAVIVWTPLVAIATRYYGAPGAAMGWIVLNAFYILVGVWVMHRRVLRGEQWRWYGEDVGIPLAVALLVASAGRWLLPTGLSLVALLGCLAAISLLVLMATMAATPVIFRWIAAHWRRQFRCGACDGGAIAECSPSRAADGWDKS